MSQLTKLQLAYIEILVIDLSMLRGERNFHMSRIVGRDVHYLEDLTKKEASLVISEFKQWKENKEEGAIPF